jgi:phage terminase Nu1 subunit (DNA packaging protein)
VATKRKNSDPNKTLTVNTQSDVAAVYAVSLPTVHVWVKQGMPGRNGAYELPAISQWLRGPGPWRQHAKPETDDPLLDAGDSPGLERYRLAKAAIAELDLEERRGALIELAKVRAALSRWSTILRRLGERLAKRFGNDAAVALNETLNECHRVIGYEFCSRDPDGAVGSNVEMVPRPSTGADSQADQPVDGR